MAIRSSDALLIVDVQRDFLPGGALAVEHAGEIVPVLNRWIAKARRKDVPVVATRDWHPANHASFQENGGPWPRHCVQHTPGAEFSPELMLPRDARIIDKGTHPAVEQYSAFEKSDLAEVLRKWGIRRLWVGGLAEDVCVRATVLDALQAGFDVHVIADATRPVSREGGRKAREQMRAAGAVFERDADDD